METPFKCPVAPLEFAFLADWFFQRQGRRDAVELIFATPLSGAFTKPLAGHLLGDMLDERGIKLVADFYPESVDGAGRVLRSYDEQEVAYDLLVTVPVNKGAEFVARSGLGDELNHVPVDAHNFLARGHDDIFALGDAAALPTSKAGSVAHFAVDIFTRNFPLYIDGREMTHAFDGHANCFIESGFGKGILIDFNYDMEPLPGKFPLPGVGPFSLLRETEINHWGKMAFRRLYWDVLLRGRDMPIPTRMSMAGKVTPVAASV
jgi:sulfide:quinone oxidoreductase